MKELYARAIRAEAPVTRAVASEAYSVVIQLSGVYPVVKQLSGATPGVTDSSLVSMSGRRPDWQKPARGKRMTSYAGCMTHDALRIAINQSFGGHDVIALCRGYINSRMSGSRQIHLVLRVWTLVRETIVDSVEHRAVSVHVVHAHNHNV